MYMYFSGSDRVVAECIYTSKTAALRAVSSIATSAVVAAYTYTHVFNFNCTYNQVLYVCICASAAAIV